MGSRKKNELGIRTRIKAKQSVGAATLLWGNETRCGEIQHEEVGGTRVALNGASSGESANKAEDLFRAKGQLWIYGYIDGRRFTTSVSNTFSQVRSQR